MAKKKIWNSALINITFRPPKMDKIGFAHGEGKNNFASGPSFLLILGLQAKYSEALCPEK